MAASSLDGLYYEFHIPLGLKTMIEQLIVNQPSVRGQTALVSGSATNREWFSQPRLGSDPTTEVITAHFKIPLSISELGFDILRVPCTATAWYLDRQNNWRQILDNQRVPLSVAVQPSSAASWYSFSTSVYPIVAQAVQIRIQRVVDPMVGTNPYVVGLKNTLIRRNVYDRAQAKLPFEDEQDPLGNVISKYVDDWDASQAIDNKPFTFWKSAPQPDPQAVVSLYLDTRSPDGSGQYMDALFLDPVYSGQKLNVYYSNDDSDIATRLSPITIKPLDEADDSNTNQRIGRGRWDTSTFPAGHSHYRAPAGFGPLVKQDTWIGIEWIPDFSAGDAPPYNPALFEANPTARVAGSYAPTVFYDSGAGAISLKFYDGTTTKTYSVTLSPTLEKNTALRIVAGWSYGPDKVYISVKDRQGNSLGLYSQTVTDLPPNITMDGKIGFSDFRGTMTAHIVKRENHTDNGEAFQANPMMYVDPDPVMPNPDGSIPSTTLDHALYAVDWTLQPHGTGGQHESQYTGRRWMPIWRDFITRRGKLFFPQAVSAKYLKLEFTGLTEENYPIYDAGIQTTYQVYPVSVSQTQTVNHPGLLGTVSGLLTVGAETMMGTLGTVNWLNPQTVAAAVNSVFGPVSNPVTVQAAPGYTTGSVPGTAQSSVADVTRTEISSPYIYRRGLLDPPSLASSTIYYAGYTTWNQTLSNAAGLLSNAIADSFTPLKNYVTSPATGPVQGNDWWIFPGGTLKMPATVMNGLTALTQTVMGRPSTTETRLRFNTESVHRYETRTVKRDAAVAYFAGVREVQPLITTYLNKQDPTIFKFDSYTEAQNWVLDNTRLIQDRPTTVTLANGDKVNAGPLSTDGRIYSIVGADFDLGIDNWEIRSGDWSWDGDAFHGRWYPGAALVSADSTQNELWSSFITSYPESDMQEGRQITFSVYTKWTGLSVLNNNPAIQLGIATYKNNELVDDDIVLGQISYANWSANTNSSGYIQLSATWTIPADIDDARLRLVVTDKATAGAVWFDNITLGSPDNVVASVYQSFQTVSDFAKLRCKFFDSGIVRSDSMWARLQEYSEWSDYDTADSPDNFPGGKFGKTPDNAPALNADGTDYVFPFASQQAYVLQRIKEIQNQGGIATPSQYKLPIALQSADIINNTQLSYYTSFISLDMFDTDGLRKAASGTWADADAPWGVRPGDPATDTGVAWGSPQSLANITIQPDRVYDGKRVLHFTRNSANASEVGVKVRQWTNMIPNGLFRICARWLKPRKNINSITVRLRRVSDGVVIYQEEIKDPATGYWNEYATSFQRLPNSDDQVYTVELVTNGDSEDELYLSDLWVEVSHVRYFITLGSNTFDVTDLRYADTAIVSCAVPVNEFTIEARIYTPLASINGCQIQPSYLK